MSSASASVSSDESSSPATGARIEAHRPGGISVIQLHQMIFIYNAVMAGWSVRHVPDTGNFLFKKRLENQQQRQDYTSDSFLRRFVQNMQRLDSASSSSPSASSMLRSSTNVRVEEEASFELPSDRDFPLV